MRPTRRCWTVVGTVCVLLVIAILGEQPIALAGAASLGAYCLVSAIRAAVTSTTTRGALSVAIDATPSHVAVNGETTLSVTASLATPPSHPVVVDCTIPAGVSGDSLRVVIMPGETQSSEHTSLTFPVGGRFDLPNVSCVVEGPEGLFTQEFRVDEQTSVTVEPHAIDGIHVGAGGEQIPRLSEASIGKLNSSEFTDFKSIRQYLPGDPVRLIDWKTTARLGEPHVREFEVEHRVSTRIIVDARSRLKVGEAGETKIDFIRQVALALVRAIHEKQDALGLTVIDDTGVRLSTETTSSAEQYHRIREELLTLGGDGGGSTELSSISVGTGPTRARLAYNRLMSRSEAPTQYVTTLRPFLHRRGSYLEQLSVDPLFSAVRRQALEQPDGAWTVLFTDDEDRASVEEATKIAARRNGRVTVFLTPSVLFEQSSLLNIEAAYERLVTFEEFRNRLERIPRVAAFNIGPDERLRVVRTRGRDSDPKREEAGHSS